MDEMKKHINRLLDEIEKNEKPVYLSFDDIEDFRLLNKLGVITGYEINETRGDMRIKFKLEHRQK